MKNAIYIIYGSNFKQRGCNSKFCIHGYHKNYLCHHFCKYL